MGRSVLMSNVLGVSIPAMVTVDGVIMNITHESVSCLAGVTIEASTLSSPKLITYSDQSGKFSITEVVKEREKGLIISFSDKEYSFSSIEIPIIEEINEVHINVIIQPSAKLSAE
jgi:hypothetical protein